MTGIGVAVVGLGVGEQHARAYARDDRVRLRWLHDLDRSRAESLAAELGGDVTDDFAVIAADPHVQAVSIASFDPDHAPQVVAVLAAGKHCFVEKPLCRTEEELRRIQAIWDPGRSVLRSNLVLRGAPLFVWLRDAIRRGDLGEIFAFDGDYLYGRLHKITEGWRSKVVDYSVMLGGGVHLVDLMLWLTGQRPTHVWSAGNRIVTRDTPFRYDDLAVATFTFPSGLIGRITANFGAVHRHQHVVRVFGSRGTFIFDDAGARLHRGRDGEDVVELLSLPAVPDTKGVLIREFVDAMVRGEDADAARHELDVIRVCLAADRARADGRTVEVGA